RLALVETICAQRSELFIRTSSFVNRTSLQLSIWRIGRATSFNCRSNISPGSGTIPEIREQHSRISGISLKC
ncbi:MAG: hypothetical protein IJE66_01860, partial [Akkermansia sp.]|nr:hypothetical protein [Akkermansia sp.]